ncbi:MAG: glycosyltransferase family 2 protein [Lachnospiraceae bacterium]|jgi:glycosyltransferase involved in cell wall biosynthesis|nr:glycosyltransferase family 2 protein [Lachnospiraceae bacterium]
MELTILMPCLNEAETLKTCIEKARAYLEKSGVDGEILIADNGSTDGSQEIARGCGARVVDVQERGYGAALIGGCNAALGTYVIMGDADDSYDFLHLDPFVEKLREGYDLVMGNRFRGGIEPGAMPPLHRYLGNPVLSFIGRLFYPSSIGDFHCGLRGYNREAMLALGLRTTGMEYASEMVVKATLYHLKIAEVPTTLKKDGRSHAPHLRSFRDGWRHLKFLLMHSPNWLFLYPGVFFIILGLLLLIALMFGPVSIGNITLDIHTMLYGSAFTIIGVSTVQFAVFTKTYAKNSGFIPVDTSRTEKLTEDRVILAGGIFLLIGVAATVAALVLWGKQSFGALDPQYIMRLTIPALTAMAVGVQMIFGGFFIGILNIRHK